MKKDIHPEYVETQVTCTCGATFTTRSTATSGTIHADVCSQCHPFYTGKQKILDTGGRVARFEARYAKALPPRSSRPERRSPASTRGDRRSCIAPVRRRLSSPLSAHGEEPDVRGRRGLVAEHAELEKQLAGSGDARRRRAWPSASTSATPS